MQLQHEVDERARQPRAGAHQHGEARAGDLRAALEVDDAERGTEVPVRLRREGERRAACRAAAPRRCRRPTSPPARVACGRFGSTQQRRGCAAARSSASSTSSCLICCARARLASWIASMSRPCFLARGHLVASRVLLALQSLDLRQQPAALGLERRQLVELGVAESVPRAGERGRARRRNGREDRAGSSTIPILPAIRWRVMDAAVRKAVFPAAGLGTRFLPATKAQPKEMLVLVDKPVIQYGVEEAVASGVANIVIVTGRGKNAIEDHFDVAVELESFLEQRGKTEQLEEIRKITRLINVAYVRQGEPLGLGHAVLVTKNLVGDEPFAVILGDDVIDAKPPALKQMIDVFHRVQGPVLAVERVPAEDVSSYGVVAVDESVGSWPGRLPDHGPGREAAARRGAVEPGDHRALHPDARHLPGARGHRPRPDRRDSADQRTAPAAEEAADLRVRDRRRPPRHRQQAGVPEGAGVLRAAAARPGRAVPALSGNADLKVPDATLIGVRSLQSFLRCRRARAAGGRRVALRSTRVPPRSRLEPAARLRSSASFAPASTRRPCRPCRRLLSPLWRFPFSA